MGIIYACAVPHPPLIVPAVGRGEEAAIQATIDAYRQVAREVVAAKPDVIIVTSPHAPYFRDAFHVTTDAMLWGSMVRFRAAATCIEAQCDTALAQAVVDALGEAAIPAVTSERYRDDMDHGTFVPLYFVREAYREALAEVRGTIVELMGTLGKDLPCPIVRLGLSMLPSKLHRELGRIIAHTADEQGKRVAFIATGDLSHKLRADGPYGYAPEGPAFDRQICELFAAGDLDGLFLMDEGLSEDAAECGLRSFQIMAGALDGAQIEAELLSYEGPFGVGYGVAAFRIADLPSCECEPSWPTEGALAEEAPDSEQKGPESIGQASIAAELAEEMPDPYIALARLSVETFVRTGVAAKLPTDVPQELLATRSGAFVSLHERGQLRGCIGTIVATCENVALEILQNGISAASRDPRFDPVVADELDYLEYSVDVLLPAEPIDSVDLLDPARYGVIVTKGWKRGLLLPNLEGVDTVDEQLSIAKRKAGISPSDAGVQLERFEVVRHTRGGEPRKP